MELKTLVKPPSTYTAPPSAALLPVNVAPVTVRSVKAMIAPPQPTSGAVLPVKVESLIDEVPPATLTAPP